MTHPEESLADYVDGTLSPAERAIVEEHLSGCGLCRGEVAMATQSRDKLATLTQEPAPAQIAAAVAGAMAEASPARTAGSKVPARYRILTALAAAAVIALAVVVLPHLGRSGNQTNQLAAGNGGLASTKEGMPAVAPSGTLRIEVQTIDYNATTAGKLIQRTPVSQPAASDSGFGASQAASDTDTNAALTCLQSAFGGMPGTPIRLIKATFQGRPAYIGVYAEGPGAGLPADTVSVRVASVTGCTLLTFTSSKI